MRKSILIILISIFNLTLLNGQENSKIDIPQFNDQYSKTINLLEGGKTDIDYKIFRENFIESKQFKIASEKSSELDKLKNEMYDQMSESNFEKVISLTQKILSIDYTNMTAHKILRQTYEIVGDTINAEKYKTIQFGLLKSIVNSGDGKTCETGWSVIQISEEYFILNMLDTKLIEQNLQYTDTNEICDKMVVENEKGETVNYYFEISKVFEGRQKLMSK